MNGGTSTPFEVLRGRIEVVADREAKKMENPHGYTHENAAAVERMIVEVGHTKETMEVRVQPNTRKAIR